LDDGNYSVTVVAAGFKNASASGLEVKRGQITQVVIDLVAAPHTEPPVCKLAKPKRGRTAARLCVVPKLVYLPRFVVDWPLETAGSAKVKWPVPDVRQIEIDDKLFKVEIRSQVSAELAAQSLSSAPVFAYEESMILPRKQFGVAQLQQRFHLKPAEPPPWQNFTPFDFAAETTNAPELEKWLAEWRAELAASHPGYGIEQANPRIFFSREIWSAVGGRNMPKKPTAWAVFGSAGVPLIVTLETDILPLPVDISVAMPGQLPDLYDRLRELGIKTADQVPNLWSQVFEYIGFTDPAPDFIPDILEDVRTNVLRIQAERQYFPGAGVDVMKRLQKTPFATDVGLANATVSELAEALGGPAFSAQARQLISNARRAVERSAWSLGNLPALNAETETGLRVLGVGSIGQLVTLQRSEAGNALLTNLGVTPEQAAQWVAHGDLTVATAAGQELDRTIFQRVVADQGKLFLESGFSSAAMMVATPPAELAARTGLSEADATAKIEAVKTEFAGIPVTVAFPTLSTAAVKTLTRAGISTTSKLAEAEASAPITRALGARYPAGAITALTQKLYFR
jgi:hypothetical protein